MEIKKTISLQADVVVGGSKVATMTTYLEGDGATPVIQTVGRGGVIGYQDDGRPILSDDINAKIEEAQTAFMSEAIKEQKKYSEENGVDPALVNIYDAEKKEKK